VPETLDAFVAALRPHLSVMTVEPSTTVARRPSRAAPYPVPESCTPYLDAKTLGLHLRPVLPILFVRNARGELVSDARVALRYVRENETRFADVLERVRVHAARIFTPEAAGALRRSQPELVSDVVQPWRSFSAGHVSLRAGLWVHTPPGVSSIVGPAMNQSSPLRVLSGSIETDWHHMELFVVVESPAFDGQALLVDPDFPLAQLHFVDRSLQDRAQITFSPSHPGAEPSYWDAWTALGAERVSSGGARVFEQRGAASVDLGCPHCYVSVTAAVDGILPEDHVLRRGFNPAYKILKHAQRRVRERSTEERGDG